MKTKTKLAILLMTLPIWAPIMIICFYVTDFFEYLFKDLEK